MTDIPSIPTSNVTQPTPSSLFRLNCIYRALLQQEQLLVEGSDRPALLKNICDRLIATGFFDIVSIGFPDADGLVRPHYAAGKQAEEFIKAFAKFVKHGLGTLSSMAMSTGKIQVSNDFLNDPRTVDFHAQARKMNIKACVEIPLVCGHQMCGVLTVTSHTEDYFDDDTLELLSTSMMLIGRALERRKLFEGVQKEQIALERLNGLYQTMLDESKFILTATDEKVLLQGTCDTLVNRGTFLLVGIGYPDEQGMMRYHYGAGLSSDEIIRGFEFSVKDQTSALYAEAWRTQTLQYSNDYSNDPRAGGLKGQLAARHINSLATAPIFRGGGIWGVISVVSSEKTFFNDNLLGLLQSCAQMLGRALDSLDMQTRVQRLTSVYKSLSVQGEIILAAPDENTLLTQTVDQLSRGGLFATVTLSRPNSEGAFEYLAVAGAGTDDLKKIHLSLKCRESTSLLVQAWRTNNLCWANDYNAEPSLRENHQVVSKIGGQSVAAVPILRKGYTWGVLVLVSDHRNFFDEEMRSLISRVAQLLGHALDEIDLRICLDEELSQQSWLAGHDTLTGLPNRTTLDSHIEQAAARAMRHNTLLAVAMMDVNDFKLINDTYGHASGDAFLRALAGRIKNTLRKTDSTFRLGGDEFVILLEDLRTIDDANTFFTRLGKVLDDPFALPGDIRINVSASIGYSVFPGDTGKTEEMLRFADSALYRVKAGKTGRTQWRIYAQL